MQPCTWSDDDAWDSQYWTTAWIQASSSEGPWAPVAVPVADAATGLGGVVGSGPPRARARRVAAPASTLATHSASLVASPAPVPWQNRTISGLSVSRRVPALAWRAGYSSPPRPAAPGRPRNAG